MRRRTGPAALRDCPCLLKGCCRRAVRSTSPRLGELPGGAAKSLEPGNPGQACPRSQPQRTRRWRQHLQGVQQLADRPRHAEDVDREDQAEGVGRDAPWAGGRCRRARKWALPSPTGPGCAAATTPTGGWFTRRLACGPQDDRLSWWNLELQKTFSLTERWAFLVRFQ